ncbi:MAG: methyltransferase domain-containing protein [Candidatus Brocadiia bacterium]
MIFQRTSSNPSSTTFDNTSRVFAPSILQMILSNTGRAVLDIDTADGYKLRRIIEGSNGCIERVTALEPSPLYQQAVEELKPCNARVGVKQISLEEYQPRLQYDTALLFEVLEHVPPKERISFITRIKSLLKPDGTLILSTPNRPVYRAKCWFSGEQPDSTHLREYSFQELRTFLAPHFNFLSFHGRFPWMGLLRRFPKLYEVTPRIPPWLSHGMFVIASDSREGLLS